MKKTFLICIFALCSLLSDAQFKTRLYYDRNWRLVNQESCIYVRECTLDTLAHHFTGEVRDFTKVGNLIMEGSYEEGVKKGSFIFYYTHGNVECQGAYEADLRQGTWTYFYEDGEPKQKIHFTNDRGRIQYFNDSTGHSLVINGSGQWMEEYELPDVDKKLVNEGFFKNYFMEGNWISRTQDGKVLFKERYKKGTLVYGLEYDNNGKKENLYYTPVPNKLRQHFKFAMTELFQFSKETDESEYPYLKHRNPVEGSSDFPSSRTGLRIMGDENFTIPEGNARPECGVQKYYNLIADEIAYPAEARKHGIDGKVYVAFAVMKDGSVNNIK